MPNESNVSELELEFVCAETDLTVASKCSLPLINRVNTQCLLNKYGLVTVNCIMRTVKIFSESKCHLRMSQNQDLLPQESA